MVAPVLSRKGTSSLGTSPEDKSNGNLEQPTAFILKLYEMISAAPDEVIAWTSAGDAFVIGADLKRLEGDTLSKFFRHNRFQSLVRQLSFYSFRKINKERNMWVYAHDLFHRDRPQDLVLLRRRNCPANVDGRRRRQDNPPPDHKVVRRIADDSRTDDSNASVEEDRITSVPREQGRKRSSDGEKRSLPLSKRPVFVWNTPHGTQENTVDMSVMQPAQLTESEDSDDQESSSSVTVDQSMEYATIVSQVASQLAIHARKANFGSANSRFVSRYQSGIVTPPRGALYFSSFSSGSLLTYDDEVNEGGIDDNGSTSFSETECLAVANKVTLFDYMHKEDWVYSAPVALEIVQSITQDSSLGEREDWATFAKVAVFCLSTCPHGEADCLLDKINSLVLSCDNLAAEFHLYFDALHPSSELVSDSDDAQDEDQSERYKDTTGDTVRGFRMFAVNAMQTLSQKIIASVGDVVVGNDHLSKLNAAIFKWQSV